MTALRPPTIAGVGGGVGTTTLAVALRGRDGGAFRADTADIVVCRGTLDSLHRAAGVLDRTGPGPRPVLAVTLDGARPPRGPLRALLPLLEPDTSAVVLLPRVPHWRTLADPLPEIATLLVDPPQRLPRPLRAYTAALRELAAAVTASGRLEVPPPRPEEARGGRAAGSAGPSRVPVAAAAGRTGAQAVPIGREERRPAPPIVASARLVAAAPRTPPHEVAPHRGDAAAAEAPLRPRRGVRILSAAPVERVG